MPQPTACHPRKNIVVFTHKNDQGIMLLMSDGDRERLAQHSTTISVVRQIHEAINDQLHHAMLLLIAAIFEDVPNYVRPELKLSYFHEIGKNLVYQAVCLI